MARTRLSHGGRNEQQQAKNKNTKTSTARKTQAQIEEERRQRILEQQRAAAQPQRAAAQPQVPKKKPYVPGPTKSAPPPQIVAKDPKDYIKELEKKEQRRKARRLRAARHQNVIATKAGRKQLVKKTTRVKKTIPIAIAKPVSKRGTNDKALPVAKQVSVGLKQTATKSASELQSRIAKARSQPPSKADNPAEFKKYEAARIMVLRQQQKGDALDEYDKKYPGTKNCVEKIINNTSLFPDRIRIVIKPEKKTKKT